MALPRNSSGGSDGGRQRRRGRAGVGLPSLAEPGARVATTARWLRSGQEREKIEDCQKQATEEKILPRDRPVVKCLDGATGPSQPSVVAPEYQELAAGRAKQKERVDNCQEQATEQKVLPRDRPQFVIGCLEK